MLMKCSYNVWPFDSFFYSSTVHVMILNILAIFNALDTTDFCMFRSAPFIFFPSNFRNPSSIVLEQTPSTSMITLYCWIVYPGYRSRTTHLQDYCFLTFTVHYLCIDSISLHFMVLPIIWYVLQCLNILGDVFWPRLDW